MLIAKYTANTSGIVPVFNEGYVYEVNETENNGIYTVEITSENDFSACSFSDKSQLLTVEHLKVTSSVTSTGAMFHNCSNLTSLDLSNFNTTNVTGMSYMFMNCKALTSLDLSSFNTSNVGYMECMFYDCKALTSLDLSSFNTSNVTTMRYMFYNCSNLTSLDVSNFDTPKVTNMGYMFYNCSNPTSLDVSNFDTSKVTNMECMFCYCKALTSLDLSSFDTSKVTTMYSMFYDCRTLTSLDVSNFDTSKVTNMEYMFDACEKLTSLDISNFDTTNVTSMYSIFQTCSNLNNIGMIYSGIDSVNVIASMLPYIEGLTRTIYMQDILADNCTPVQGVIFRDYKGCSQTLHLPIQLVNGAELYWDNKLGRYCIRESSGNITQTDITNLITLDTYNNYYKIVTDEKETPPTSITVNIAMKFREEA